ncbi:MAG: M20/M25/M40 family metallo-hydrolase [Candidatus Sulfopaludibacter sp.]|nr:M20/M25/M40 family metallo-hydrolase [Candidatus Sulfopaludibacter sp.]
MRKLLAGLSLCGLLAAQTAVDEGTFARIRSEEAEHSQIMHTLHMLTDRYGPRLTGSPNHEAAAKWAVQQLTGWGFKNAHLEPWEFGHPGWLNERAAGYIVSPVHENLKFEVLAWTPSTKGTVTGSVVEVVLPRGPEIPRAADAGGGRGGRGAPAGPQYQQPTQAELTAWMEANQASVKGKIVMVGKAAVIPVNFEPVPLRRDDEQVRQSYDPNNPNAGRGFGRGGAGRGAPDPSRLTAAQVAEQVDGFLVANGASMRINDAGMDHGLIRAFNNRTFDEKKAVPTVVMRNEDYGRIERLAGDGDDVKLEFTIVNHWYPEGKTTYNVVAEIPGSDKADEVVMLGGHLDSWHAATGATDNAIGSSIMMEAARLIQALGLKPRRTIRVALWSGEEEGLLGSKAYVAQHFGTAEDPKPEWYKLDCYFNVDSGTGRLRGAGVFGPPEAAVVLRPALKEFEDWGVFGANVTNSRATGGTDSTSFNAAGLPGVGLQQDPVEYQSFTWHTNLDTYERIVPEDVKHAATEVSAAVWHVANLDRMVPRFSKEAMPKPPEAGRGQ